MKKTFAVMMIPMMMLASQPETGIPACRMGTLGTDNHC